MKVDVLRNAASATIVVVGGGLAGLSASLEAVRYAKARDVLVNVLMLEKGATLGGNSAKASSGLSALTPASGDSEESFISDTLKSGGGLSDEQLVRKLVSESSDALAFLEGFGVDLSKLSQCGAHSVVRTHRNQKGPNVGLAIMKALIEAAEREEAIRVVTGMRVQELITRTPSTGVLGVAYAPSSEEAGQACSSKSAEARADAVVLATGGYAASAEQLLRWAPAVSELPTTNGPFATGDGVLLGQQLGASAVDLEQVQVHPTAIIDPAHPEARTKWLAPEALRGSGGVLLGPDGRRFVDELQKRSVVTQAMFKLPSKGGAASLVLGEVAANTFGLGTLGFYASKGLAAQHEGFAALAQHLGVAEATLREEAAAYDAAMAEGEDKFGKTVFPAPFGQRADQATPVGGSFFSVRVQPALHYCMGGLRIGSSGQVLREVSEPAANGSASFEPIPGLFAAGEVTGGVHGKNRLAGNSLLECVVFGRAAGRAAVDAALSRMAEASSLPDSANDKHSESQGRAQHTEQA